jgi:hypothetical protein
MVPFMVKKSEALGKHNELVESLQVDARMLFYDRMMYDINDSLTSILALCDVEAKGSIPKIKQYINRINESLKNTKSYNSSFTGEKRFNISLVLRNLLRVIKENYKEAKLSSVISEIKAPVPGDQSKFEQIVLYMFVEMALKNASDSDMLIELRQKDKNAMLTILKDDFTFSKESLKIIDKLKGEDDFRGSIQINPQGKGVEVIIKVPLQFKVVRLSEPQSKETPQEKEKVRPKRAELFTWGERKQGIPELSF